MKIVFPKTDFFFFFCLFFSERLEGGRDCKSCEEPGQLWILLDF